MAHTPPGATDRSSKHGAFGRWTITNYVECQTRTLMPAESESMNGGDATSRWTTRRCSLPRREQPQWETALRQYRLEFHRPGGHIWGQQARRVQCQRQIHWWPPSPAIPLLPEAPIGVQRWESDLRPVELSPSAV